MKITTIKRNKHKTSKRGDLKNGKALLKSKRIN